MRKIAEASRNRHRFVESRRWRGYIRGEVGGPLWRGPTSTPHPTPSPAADFLRAHPARSKRVIGIICPAFAGAGQISVHSEGDEMSERGLFVVVAAAGVSVWSVA